MFHNCTRKYKTHGNVESYFQLAVPIEDSPSGFSAELVYAPYLDTLSHGYGPGVSFFRDAFSASTERGF
jgi:hypothetical protein